MCAEMTTQKYFVEKTITNQAPNTSGSTFFEGDILPAYDITYNVGSAALRWAAIYAYSGVYTGPVDTFTLTATGDIIQSIGTANAKLVIHYDPTEQVYRILTENNGADRDLALGVSTKQDSVIITNRLSQYTPNNNIITLNPDVFCTTYLSSPFINVMGLGIVDQLHVTRNTTATSSTDINAGQYCDGGLAVAKDLSVGGSILNNTAPIVYNSAGNQVYTAPSGNDCQMSCGSGSATVILTGNHLQLNASNVVVNYPAYTPPTDGNFPLDVTGPTVTSDTSFRVIGGNATAYNNGAVRVQGGIGVSQDMYINGNLHVAGTTTSGSTTNQSDLQLTDTINPTAYNTGTLLLTQGGAGIYGNVVTNGIIEGGTSLVSTGTVTAGAAADVSRNKYGQIILSPGNSPNTGYIGWYVGSGATRLAYLGFGNPDINFDLTDGQGNLNLNLKSGSTTTHHRFTNTGNVGINTITPAATLDVNGTTIIESTAASTSSTSGALQVKGGMGILGNINSAANMACQNMYVASALYGNGALTVGDGTNFANTANSTSPTTGAVTIVGGLGVGNNIVTGGSLKLGSSLGSSSTTTGALIVPGGAGIGQNLFVGGTISSNSGSYLTLTNGAGSAQFQLAGNTTNVTGTMAMNNTTDSTSITTGSFTLAGGMAVTKNLYVGGYVASASGNYLTLANGAGSAQFQLAGNTTNVTGNVTGAGILFNKGPIFSNYGFTNITSSSGVTYTSSQIVNNVVGRYWTSSPTMTDTLPSITNFISYITSLGYSQYEFMSFEFYVYNSVPATLYLQAPAGGGATLLGGGGPTNTSFTINQYQVVKILAQYANDIPSGSYNLYYYLIV